MCVVPSVMLLIGKANWWFPKSLDRVLPHIGLEHADATAIAVPAAEGGSDGDPGTAASEQPSSIPVRT
jgi:RND superfamily putative drug exporter